MRRAELSRSLSSPSKPLKVLPLHVEETNVLRSSVDNHDLAPRVDGGTGNLAKHEVFSAILDAN
jgi:hypothetical protein